MAHISGTQPEEQQIPGESLSWKSTLLTTTSNIVQNFDPIKSVDLYLSGFAFYADNPSKQVELHHYCHKLNEEVTQCSVYESNEPNARLLGVEYVVSERIFQTLSPDEQRYWHSHACDVKCGSFIAPGMPEIAEKPLMTELARTYGKTWLLWQPDNNLPIGPPKLMMVCVKEEQWSRELFERRDQKLGFDSRRRKENYLKDMEMPPVHPNADSWTRGETPKISIEKQAD